MNILTAHFFYFRRTLIQGVKSSSSSLSGRGLTNLVPQYQSLPGYCQSECIYMRVLTIKSFLDDQIIGGELYGFGTNVLSHLLGFPLTHLVEGHVDHLAGRTLLAAKNEEVKFGSLGEGWFESETKVFNHENGAFGVLSLDGLSLVAGLIDRLVVQSHVGVLDVAGCLPVVCLEESDVDGPLQSGGRAHQLASGQFSKRA